MIKLYNEGTGEEIGTISEEQLQFLEDELVEESDTDQDYAITPLTLGLFVEDGGDPALIEMLRGALGEQEEIQIRWRRE